MQDLANTVNQQIRLAARPVGLPKDSDWKFTTEPVALPGDGGVLVRTLSLSGAGSVDANRMSLS